MGAPAPLFGTVPNIFDTNKNDTVKKEKKNESAWNFGSSAPSFPTTPAKTDTSTSSWGAGTGSGSAMQFSVPTGNDNKALFGATNEGFRFGGTSDDKPKLTLSKTEPIAMDADNSNGNSFGNSSKNALSRNNTFSWGDSNTTKNDFSFGNGNQNGSTNAVNTSGFGWSSNNANQSSASPFGNGNNNASAFNNASSFGSSNNNWSIGANKGNDNNSFSFASNNQNSGGNKFSFQPTNNNNNNNATTTNSNNPPLGAGFFQKSKGKKRKIVKAKRRLRK